MSYVVGAQDADRIVKELNNLYTADDLVGLGKYQLAMKMSVDSQMTLPFSSYGLPLPDTLTHQKEKVLKATYEKYYRKIEPMDMSQVTSQMTPAPKRYSENKDVRPAIPYQPQLPPTPVLTKPNSYKIPPATTTTYSPAASSPPLLSEPSPDELDNLRKQGLRPSVVGCFLNDNKILLAYQKSFNQWTLPQGGVKNKETTKDTLFRELAEEVTQDFINKCSRDAQLIAVDKIEFPPSKQGLREMKTDSGEPVVMKGKYYYFYTTEANDRDITLGATEFDDIKWLNYEEAYKLIKETNTGGRLRMTLNLLNTLRDKGLLSTNQPINNGSKPEF
ncbi:MAG: hypothetical protein ACD_61C00092G0001, partial [uncultured bacterium]